MKRNAREIAHEFWCIKCQHLCEDPVEASCCRNLFCRSCVPDRSDCPICGLPVKVTTECSKPLLALLEQQRMRCPYSMDTTQSNRRNTTRELPTVKRSPQSGEFNGMCNWEGTYATYITTHTNECLYYPVACSFGCGTRLPRKDIESHEYHCTKNMIRCKVCKLTIPANKRSAHHKAYMKLHLELLKEKVREKEEYVEIRAMTIRETIQKQYTTHVIWQLREARNIMEHASYPKGQSLSSTNLTARGINFTLAFYPNGDETSLPGCARIDIEALSSTSRVHFKFTLNNLPPHTETCLGKDHRSGSCEWPKRADITRSLQETNDIIEIKVEILDATVITETTLPTLA